MSTPTASSPASSSPPSSPPPATSPSPPETVTGFSSLPTELVEEIFSHLADVKTRHNPSLACLCLVDQTWLSLARPLLYRDLSISLGTKAGKAWPSSYQLCLLLIKVKARAELVRRLDLFLGDFTERDFVDFAHLLSATRRLVSISLSEGRYCRGDFSGRISDLIALHRPDLRELDLKGFTLSGGEAARALERLGHLRRLSLSLIPPFEAIERAQSTLVPNLSHLVSLDLVTPLSLVPFRQTFSNSFLTLTELRVFLDDRFHPLDLSPLENLTRLRLDSAYSERHRITLKGGHFESVLSSTSRLEKLLHLSLSIPRTTTRLSSSSEEEGEQGLERVLVRFLPRSIERLSILSFGWNELDLSVLFSSRSPPPRPRGGGGDGPLLLPRLKTLDLYCPPPPPPPSSRTSPSESWSGLKSRTRTNGHALSSSSSLIGTTAGRTDDHRVSNKGFCYFDGTIEDPEQEFGIRIDWMYRVGGGEQD